VVTTPDALVQRVPPREVWAGASLAFKIGDRLDLADLESFCRKAGYRIDDRVDEAGEIAIRGQVVDIFPAGAAVPFRLEHPEGTITGIRCYDPVTQRTLRETDSLVLAPASELVLTDGGEDPVERTAGIEHVLPDFYTHLESLPDYLPQAVIYLAPGVKDRHRDNVEQIAEAYEARTTLRAERAASAGRPALPPERLYLTDAEWSALFEAHRTISLEEASGRATGEAVQRFAAESAPNRAFAAFIRDGMKRGRRIVLAAGAERDLRTLVRRAAQNIQPQPAADWDAVLAAPSGALLTLPLALDAGFIDQSAGVAVVAAADLLGRRTQAADADAPQPLAVGDVEFRLGDAVIHIDHGMAVLRGLEGGAAGDVVRLEYAGNTNRMIPVEEIDRIWRYGSEAESVSLDRLEGEAWPKRRAKVEAEIRETAGRLAELVREREATEAPKLVPPRRAYERFIARFPFSETPDQLRAIDDTLRDLASGRPMDRLVCGDVGFGKTEVALRAAVAAALAGKQVALVAPTTVLVRQHVRTFTRRFADMGIEVSHLSRLVKPAEAKAVKAGLKDGSIRMVIGTHALAAKGVGFADLGLVIIDEEQRFGTADKAKLRALARHLHVLTLTATPIPRTLQAAMVGLQDLSIIATPPVRRRPIRTFLASFDSAMVREALLREKRRGGQSFFVCPRIEDIEPMRARVRDLAPELEVVVAHGKMPAEQIDEAMVGFADGQGDVLLSTNIIESGLDVPQANTMLIWRADRFGLAQLHQLRGRVGRGRMRGIAYFLTDPESRIGEATTKRLQTLEALDRLGAGFAISARDLDMRGAGDLMGEEQAGHVKLIGLGLYQHLLERALRAAKGESLDDDWSPELKFGTAGSIPENYVPEQDVRLNLYARLARLQEPRDIDALRDEIEDRFGALPEEVEQLIGLARLRPLCRRLGVARIEAGPQAIALSFRPGRGENRGIMEALQGFRELQWKGDRLIAKQSSQSVAERQRLAAELLEGLDQK
jgi:transcription-repair coupling factor (superfamily II helicase)